MAVRVIGPKLVKLALIATVIAAIVIGAVVAVIFIVTGSADCEITGVNINNGTVTWNNKHLGVCSFYVKIDDNEVVTVDHDFYKLPENLDSCISHTIEITPFNSKHTGLSVTQEFEIDIREVVGVNVTLQEITWDNTQVKSCSFMIEINGKVGEVPSGGDGYVFEEVLEYCTKYEIEITPVGGKKFGKAVSIDFDEGPEISDFTIKQNADLISYKASWKTLEDVGTKCSYNVTFDDDILSGCDGINVNECDFSLDKDLQYCNENIFQLRRITTDDEYELIDEYNYTLEDGVINDFRIEFERNDTDLLGSTILASWSDLGPNCEYEIIIENVEPISVNGNSTEGVYEKYIPVNILDLCASVYEISLIAKYNDVNVAESKEQYTPEEDLAIITDLTLEINPENKINASWFHLGESCSYNVKYNNGDKYETQDANLIIDDHFQINPNYCIEHSVSVSVNKENAKEETEQIFKDLPENFQALKDMISPIYLPGPDSYVTIEWQIIEEFKLCKDIFYNVSCSLGDNQEALNNPVEVHGLSHRFEECEIGEVPETFYAYIQPVQESTLVTGQKMVCILQLSENGVDSSDCDYVN